MRPNATLIVGLVLTAVSIIAIWGGLSLIDDAFDDAASTELTCDSLDASDCESDDGDLGIMTCLRGLLVLGIGLGMGISGIITLTTGGAVQLGQMIGGGKKAAKAASTIVVCPHCNNDVAIGSGVKGTFDCPHCKRDFVWD